MISIAICDDNEITTQEIAKKVEQYCPVETEFSIFHHPKDLLDSMYAKEKAYDIVLMDTEFESASGIEAVKQINAWHPDSQIIYITNHAHNKYLYSRWSLSNARKIRFYQ